MKKLLEKKEIGGYVIYFNENQKQKNIVELIKYDYMMYNNTEHLAEVFQITKKDNTNNLEYFNVIYCEYFNYYTLSIIEDIIDEINKNDEIKAKVLKTLK